MAKWFLSAAPRSPAVLGCSRPACWWARCSSASWWTACPPYSLFRASSIPSSTTRGSARAMPIPAWLLAGVCIAGVLSFACKPWAGQNLMGIGALADVSGGAVVIVNLALVAVGLAGMRRHTAGLHPHRPLRVPARHLAHGSSDAGISGLPPPGSAYRPGTGRGRRSPVRLSAAYVSSQHSAHGHGRRIFRQILHDRGHRAYYWAFCPSCG